MNRRRFLRLPELSVHAATPSAIADGDDPLAPWSPSSDEPWDYATAAHLLRRTTVGPRDAEIRRAVTEGLDRTLTRLFRQYAPAHDTLEFARQDPLVSYGVTPDVQEWWDIFWRYREWMHELTRWQCRTLIAPTLSMQEKMTFFWHSHFTMELEGVSFPELMFESIDTLRRNCFGNVRELAWLMTIDLGMLQYLDGWINRAYPEWREINENYARELLELYTVGTHDRDGTPNYTQEDVRAAALALTGWTYGPSERGPLFGALTSRFVEEAWDRSEKTFLGRTGAWGARDIVDIIFEERAAQAGRYIGERLYRFFVHDDPDEAVVDALAAALREANWDVRPALERLLRSRHFLSPAMHGGLARPVVDYHLGLIRTLAITEVPDFRNDASRQYHTDLYDRLQRQGQLPLNPPNVNGWPGGRRWLSASTVPERIGWARGVVEGTLTGHEGNPAYVLDVERLLRSLPSPNDPHELVADLVRLLLPSPLDDAEMAGFVATLLDGGPDYEWSIDDPAQSAPARTRRLLSAIVSHPTFQLF